MPDPRDGLDCRCGRLTADDERITRDDAATSNVTDLRRARQRARATMRNVLDAVLSWLGQETGASFLSSPTDARRANQALTAIASQRLREDLATWLDERHRITMGRAVRAAHDQMAGALPRGMDPDDLTGRRDFGPMEREAARQVAQVDAGLLYDTELAEELGLTEPLAEELGDDLTRTLRQGVRRDEPVQTGRDDQTSLTDRVRGVLTDAGADVREGTNVSGQTKRSKAELIAHDSVQDAYNQAARGRYLRNGFRFAVFDATLDTKTTDLCRRMDETVIDLRDDPFLVPPLHPYCRSGIRPTLDADGSDRVGRDDIADDFLSTIAQTKSYRPPVDAAGTFEPTAITRDLGQT